MDKYCKHCYLQDAKPCMECNTCNPGHRNFRPAPAAPPDNAAPQGCDFCNAPYVVLSGSRISKTGTHVGCKAQFCPKCGKPLPATK